MFILQLHTEHPRDLHFQLAMEIHCLVVPSSSCLFGEIAAVETVLSVYLVLQVCLLASYSIVKTFQTGHPVIYVEVNN